SGHFPDRTQYLRRCDCDVIARGGDVSRLTGGRARCDGRRLGSHLRLASVVRVGACHPTGCDLPPDTGKDSRCGKPHTQPFRELAAIVACGLCSSRRTQQECEHREHLARLAHDRGWKPRPTAIPCRRPRMARCHRFSTLSTLSSLFIGCSAALSPQVGWSAGGADSAVTLPGCDAISAWERGFD